MENRGSAKDMLGIKWYTVFDWPLLFFAVAIAFLGIVVIYSATYASDSQFLRSLYIRQIEWNIYGIITMVLMVAIGYQRLERPAYLLYFVFLLLLLKVLFSGRVISGSQRWLSIAGFNVQPSELVKIVIVLILARYFDDRRDIRDSGFYQLIVPCLIALVPAILIAKQPDLGTGMIVMFIFVAMAFVNGIRRRVIVTVTMATLVAIPVIWHGLKGYQKNRIIAMFDPSSDPLGIGYHTIQSKIAIGSGGLWGKGFFAGTQSKLNFLPEKHTDFIFAVFAEEAGFLGAIILLALYLVLILRMIDVALKAKDRAGSLIAIGITTMFAFHFLYNVSMTIGLTPIIGIPMPLFSYGGSALLTNYAAIGLLLSISMERYRRD